MGLFGGNDENDEDEKNVHRGGFEEAEYFSHKRTCKRVIDEEAEVVLYGVSVGSAFTITAVPLKDTALELPDKSEQSEEQE